MSIIPGHSEESILELIGLIYDSALDPHHWVALMRRMTEILKGSSCTVHHQDLGSLAGNSPLLGVLMPHLKRAFELHMRIQGLGSKGNAAAEALNHLQEGVILLDARGLVLFANDAANLTLRQEKALKLTSAGIRAMSPLEDKKFARLVAEAIATGSGRGFQAAGTMTIELEFPRRFLHLSVTPLRSRAIQFGKASPVAAIFLADNARETMAPTRLLAQLYGLTPAEARLAQLLASGISIKEASEKLNVSQNTLRTQLKSIFSKTDVNRQSELVRLLLTGPLQLALRQPPAGPKWG